MNSIAALIIAIILSALLCKKAVCDTASDPKTTVGDAVETLGVAPLSVNVSETSKTLPDQLSNSANPDSSKDDLDTAQFFFPFFGGFYPSLYHRNYYNPYYYSPYYYNPYNSYYNGYPYNYYPRYYNYW